MKHQMMIKISMMKSSKDIVQNNRSKRNKREEVMKNTNKEGIMNNKSKKNKEEMMKNSNKE